MRCAGPGVRWAASRPAVRSPRFDVVGFSLQYEMTFTNVLEMLDLGGHPAALERARPGRPARRRRRASRVQRRALGRLRRSGVRRRRRGDDPGVPRPAEGAASPRRRSSDDPARVGAHRGHLRAGAVHGASAIRRHGLLVPEPSGDAPYPVQRRISDRSRPLPVSRPDHRAARGDRARSGLGRGDARLPGRLSILPGGLRVSPDARARPEPGARHRAAIGPCDGLRRVLPVVA